MKLNENFVLRQVADIWVVLPLGQEALNFNGMLKLNGAGVLLWNRLESGADQEDLVQALLEEYEVSKEQAAADVAAFVEKLSRIGCIETQ